MPKVKEEGGKNADSSSGSTTAVSELDPFDDIPDPTDSDFLDVVEQEERKFYLQKFDELKRVKQGRLHCTACDKHLGLLTRHTNRYRMHPLLRSLVCISCYDFYNSGEFEKGEDGSELYCRWCGQGGQVYCCASCPVVFCERCIKRNFGASKINEIETNDDWKCFVCNPKSLWLIRARFWVLILYCNFKNKQAQACTDSAEKVILLRKCQVDESECCKPAVRQRNTPRLMVDIKKKVSSPDVKPLAKPTPDQKKTISINEARQAIKRLGSPVSIKKVTVPSTPTIPNVPVQSTPLSIPVQNLKVAIPSLTINPIASNAPKRMRMTSPMLVTNLPPPLISRFNANSVTIRPDKPKVIRKPTPQVNMYNGYMQQSHYAVASRDMYSAVIHNDSLNLSLESLTQGTEIGILPTMSSQNEEDSVVCTPDIPMDTQEEGEMDPPYGGEGVENGEASKADDDVQCLTPTPKIVPKPLSALTEPKQNKPYPAVLPSTAFSNIIQMTENDVTINEVTGGLKFKVDPSTLSSSKMYKLPDGRIFAVNNNPNMPGGYSATIVAIDEASLARSGLGQARSQRLQQRLQRQSKAAPPQPPKLHSWTTPVVKKATPRQYAAPSPSTPKSTVDPSQPAGSVEWFKFNVVDAIEIMNYVLHKLNKLKYTSQELRTKSISDIKEMHLSFEQTLKTSCKRFDEVRETLNTGYKAWLKEKNCMDILSDDEDEVQILPSEEPPKPAKRGRPKKVTNDEPIFIDENSNDSSKNVNSSKDEDYSCEVQEESNTNHSNPEDQTSIPNPDVAVESLTESECEQSSKKDDSKNTPDASEDNSQQSQESSSDPPAVDNLDGKVSSSETKIQDSEEVQKTSEEKVNLENGEESDAAHALDGNSADDSTMDIEDFPEHNNDSNITDKDVSSELNKDSLKDAVDKDVSLDPIRDSPKSKDDLSMDISMELDKAESPKCADSGGISVENTDSISTE